MKNIIEFSWYIIASAMNVLLKQMFEKAELFTHFAVCCVITVTEMLVSSVTAVDKSKKNPLTIVAERCFC